MTFNYKNTPINYETYGSGPALILLHGFLESAVMWNPFLPELSEKNFIITLDLPGHGESGVVSKIHSMELMAEVVNELLIHLGVTSATIVGHSMGGYVTMAFAEIFPQKIEQLILLNSTPTADSEERKENRNRALKVFGQNPSAFISMAITNLFAETSREQFSEEIELLKKQANSFPHEGITAAIKGMRDRKDRTEVLKNFKKGKFSILSKADPLLSLEETKQVAESCNSHVLTIDGGHHSTYENLSGVIEKLDFILKR